MTNSIRSFNVSTTYKNGQDFICFKDFSNVEVVLNIARLSKLYFVQILGYRLWNLSFGKTYAALNIQDDVLYIKISELKKEFNLTKKAILIADLSNTLHDLIAHSLEIKARATNRFQLEKARRQGLTLQEFYELENFSKTLKIPTHELLLAKKNGTFCELIDQARILHKRVDAVYARIAILHEDSFFFAPSIKSFSLIKLSKQDLHTVKETVKIAFKILASSTRGPEKEVEAIIPVSNTIFIFAKSSKKSLEVMGLFGKKIGAGSYGNVIQCVDFITGSFKTRENSVLKIPNTRDALLQIFNEVKILKKLDGMDPPASIQKPVTLVKCGKKVFGAIGKLYLTNLEIFLQQSEMTEDLKRKFSFQLIHAVAKIHKIDLVHGDIKAANVFIDMHDNNLLYLSDFGGSQHLEDSVRFISSGIHTRSFRRYKDFMLSQIICRSNDLIKYREIEKKCDIFALAVLIFQIFTKELPYIVPENYKNDLNVYPDVCTQLQKYVSINFAEMLTLALCSEYVKRPTADQLLKAFSS